MMLGPGCSTALPALFRALGLARLPLPVPLVLRARRVARSG
jgi:hypothetical protein